ncbi:MAG: sugar kinase [Eubacteriales bacterium]|jgi:2-dehydro-3-deoxygluconokinase|nr:sugar kinase [Eubacteriales bacterium]MDD4105602.1 sugar kinase [Eubacteriales bacterium]MDD4710870.1 sugar kinase [Eubacteriales bacterium]NLO14893.1 sugar kinase [Clostridiales bacterium]
MFDLITPTSMGVRITPEDRQPAGIGSRLFMQATSAESNVLNVSASLGLKTRVLTAFVKDSPIAAFIKRELGRRFIDFVGPELEQGGPWGLRHQFNIADSGFGVRGPRVHNDRAGEVGRLLETKYFDLEKILETDGARMIHFSGLFAALSPETAQFCLDLANKAKETGTKISFDLNHRASFWKNREAELRDVFSAIASEADILIGNEEDYQLALGLHGPEAGGKNVGDKTAEFQGMISQARKQYPKTKVFATTLRQVISANEHLWGALLNMDDKWHIAPPRAIQVLDRIGGGDSFVSGLLYGLLKGWDGEKCLHFAWAAGALTCTMLEDYASPADEEQIWSIWEGNARVKR